MKLWQKIFLCTLTLVIIAIEVTATLLLSNNHRILVEREEQRGISEHAYFASYLKETLIFQRLESGRVLLDRESVKQEISAILEEQESDGMGISLYEDGVLWLSVNRHADENIDQMLEKAKQQNCVRITDEGEKTYLLAASTVSLEGRNYQLVTTSDITEIYSLRESQLQYVRQLSIICAVLVAGVLLVMVWTLLLPLKRINEGTRQIAQGKYDKRLKMRGNSELAELARNMNVMARAVEKNVTSLKQVAEDRNTFIANLAHEMKTPLTSILGFADILRVKRVVSDRERQEYAGVIVEETKRLKALSGKLMELITMGSTQLDWTVVPLSQLTEEVGTALQPLLEDHGMELQVSAVDEEVRVDKELFKSLLYNLIDNAVKASKPGGKIELAAAKVDGVLHIAVRDHGIGIPAKELNRITQPFYMLDKSRSRKAGGAGLGLPLCVEIARLHGAQLTIDSEVGKGTCVHLIFRGETEHEPQDEKPS